MLILKAYNAITGTQKRRYDYELGERKMKITAISFEQFKMASVKDLKQNPLKAQCKIKKNKI